MWIVRRAAGVGLITLLAGCELGLGLDGLEFSCGFMGEGPGCSTPAGLALEPYGANVLKGETLTVVTRSDSGHARSDWTVSGPAAFVVNGALTSTVTSTISVRLHAVGVGQSTIEAQSTNSAHRATGIFTVADSSVIASVSFWQFTSDSVRYPGGSQVPILCTFHDARQFAYFARPTSWTSSDTSVATIVQDPNTRNCAGVLRTRKAGQTQIVAHFLGVSGTLRVYVTP